MSYYNQIRGDSYFSKVHAVLGKSQALCIVNFHSSHRWKCSVVFDYLHALGLGAVKILFSVIQYGSGKCVKGQSSTRLRKMFFCYHIGLQLGLSASTTLNYSPVYRNVYFI